jgi:hypothetical protein
LVVAFEVGAGDAASAFIGSGAEDGTSDFEHLDRGGEAVEDGKVSELSNEREKSTDRVS